MIKAAFLHAAFAANRTAVTGQADFQILILLRPKRHVLKTPPAMTADVHEVSVRWATRARLIIAFFKCYNKVRILLDLFI